MTQRTQPTPRTRRAPLDCSQFDLHHFDGITKAPEDMDAGQSGGFPLWANDAAPLLDTDYSDLF